MSVPQLVPTTAVLWWGGFVGRPTLGPCIVTVLLSPAWSCHYKTSTWTQRYTTLMNILTANHSHPNSMLPQATHCSITALQRRIKGRWIYKQPSFAIEGQNECELRFTISWRATFFSREIIRLETWVCWTYLHAIVQITTCFLPSEKSQIHYPA